MKDLRTTDDIEFIYEKMEKSTPGMILVLAQNPNINDDIFEQILLREDESVNYTLATKQNLTFERAKLLFMTQDKAVAAAISRRIDPKMFDLLLEDNKNSFDEKTGAPVGTYYLQYFAAHMLGKLSEASQKILQGNSFLGTRIVADLY
jgi:hypothetical protein